MKRIIVRSVIEDIKSTAAVSKNRSEMIKKAPTTALASSYQANVKAEILHPKNFPLSVVKTVEAENYLIVELMSAEGEKAFWFKAGQFLTLKFRHGEAEMCTSLPVASLPGESRIIAFVTAASGDEVYDIFKNREAENIIGVSFEGNFNYSALRDGKDVCIITDIHAVAAVISLVNSFCNICKDTKFRIVCIGEGELFPLLSELSEAENVAVEIKAETVGLSFGKGSSVIVHGLEHFCGRVDSEISEQKLELKSFRVHKIGKIKEFISSKQHSCKVIIRGEETGFMCREGETLTSAFERNKVPVNVRCSNGECGYCRSRLISGEVRSLMDKDEHRTAADIKYGYIHPCSVTAVSDLVIEI